jgi:hypothetical protein
MPVKGKSIKKVKNSKAVDLQRYQCKCCDYRYTVISFLDVYRVVQRRGNDTLRIHF